MQKIVRAFVVFVLCFTMVEVNYVLNANAGMIPTSQVVADLNRAQNIETVQAFIQRGELAGEFTNRGVSQSEAAQRVASLTDAELQDLAQNIKTAPAGAEPVLVIGLTTILLIVLIVILLRR